MLGNKEYICSLAWYDGPFEMIFKDKTSENYFFTIWGDYYECEGERLSHWLGIECSKEDLYNYFSKKISLKNMFQQNEKFFFWETYSRFFGVKEEIIPDKKTWMCSVENILEDEVYYEEGFGHDSKNFVDALIDENNDKKGNKTC